MMPTQYTFNDRWMQPGSEKSGQFLLTEKNGHSSVVSPVVLFHFTASAQLHKVVTHVNLGLAGMPGDRF